MTLFGAGVHPDIPNFFVHFTGRPRADNDLLPPQLGVTPEMRLASIGLTGGMYAKPVYGTFGPVVCFSECSQSAIRTLFSTGVVTWRGPWAPWAIIFDRERLIAAGARPVWLMDETELAVTNDMPMPLPDRRQKYVPGRVDFTAEREWRLSLWSADWDGHAWPWWSIQGLVAGVIVGHHNWLPAPDWATSYGHHAPVPRYADVLHGVPRWFWNGVDLVPDGYCDIAAQKAWGPPQLR